MSKKTKKIKKKICKLYKKLLIKQRRDLKIFLESTSPKYWNKSPL